MITTASQNSPNGTCCFQIFNGAKTSVGIFDPLLHAKTFSRNTVSQYMRMPIASIARVGELLRFRQSAILAHRHTEPDMINYLAAVRVVLQLRLTSPKASAFAAEFGLPFSTPDGYDTYFTRMAFNAALAQALSRHFDNDTASIAAEISKPVNFHAHNPYIEDDIKLAQALEAKLRGYKLSLEGADAVAALPAGINVEFPFSIRNAGRSDCMHSLEDGYYDGDCIVYTTTLPPEHVRDKTFEGRPSFLDGIGTCVQMPVASIPFVCNDHSPHNYKAKRCSGRDFDNEVMIDASVLELFIKLRCPSEAFKLRPDITSGGGVALTRSTGKDCRWIAPAMSTRLPRNRESSYRNRKWGAYTEKHSRGEGTSTTASLSIQEGIRVTSAERAALSFDSLREHSDGRSTRGVNAVTCLFPSDKSMLNGKEAATRVHVDEWRSGLKGARGKRILPKANSDQLLWGFRGKRNEESGQEIDPFVGNLWYPCNHGFGRKRRKTSIFKTKPTRIYSAQRWAQGHCRQDAAALPDTMPTPVRHRLWHLLEARAVTSRARSHLLLASAGVAPLYECPSGFRSKIELDGTWKSADREKSLPWCQDAARVAQQSNTVPTFVQHRLQHLLGHVAEASTGGAVGVHEEADDVEVVRSGIPLRGMVEARARRIARREYHGTLVSPFPAGIGLLDDSNSDTTRSTATALEGYGTSDEHSIVTDWGNLTGTGNAEGGAATNGDRPE
ncbi:hypothetical protein C8R46DRAFT_1035902 [Mycena filopes]|nr:hypothetical protein C8R46DRAFT_1035902 [Mycena filopes]